MARQPKDLLRHLTDALGRPPALDFDLYEKVIDTTAAYNRTLMGVYSLLAVGTALLLFFVEMSPWAGAAMLASWVVFVVGVCHTSLHVMAYNKMLLMADAIQRGEQLVDSDIDEEKATPQALLRNEAVTRGLHRTKSGYTWLGFLVASIALAIEHWAYAWRAAAFLGGLAVVIIVLRLVLRVAEGAIGRSEYDEEDDDEEEYEEANDRA
jgi:hypothetical protein